MYEGRDRRAGKAKADIPKDVNSSYETALDMLATAAALLEKSPDSSGLSPRAAGELSRVLSAEGVEESEITGQKIDYTIFKPRGHYTLAPEFERYFRAMGYIGSAELPLFDSASGEPITENITTAALVSLVLDSLGGAWESFEEPIGFLVGVPNSGDPKTFRALVRKHIGKPNRAESYKNLSDAAKISVLAEEISKKIEGPKIQSVAGIDKEDSDFANRAQVFRISGKRFTYDAYIMNMLTSPRAGTDDTPRNIPEGTDVMAVLGSKAAGIWAEKNFGVKNYKENLEALKKEAPGYLRDERTVYAKWLSVFKAGFEDSGSDQFFYNDSAWQWKKLSAYLASWAELKHDTILYGEQSGAEAGDGGFLNAGRFAPPQPRGYVEPDPKVFDALIEATDELAGFLGKYDMEPPAPEDDYRAMMDDYGRKLSEFTELLKSVRVIAQKEVDGAEITTDDYAAIKELARGFTGRILLPGTGEFYGDGVEERLKMALIADVATNGFDRTCLEAATGTPRKIYVFANDKSGGARLTRGYVYSYYEFERPLSEGRMTDEEWKAIVYDASRAEELEKYRPAWHGELEK
jgi:hypothetical protein